MKVICETPNGKWAVVEQTNPAWQSVFGTESVYYNAYRKEDMFLVFSGAKVSNVLQWFRKMKIISEDELQNQIEKIGK